jgi:uncharacterized protein (TIGR01244 family)
VEIMRNFVLLSAMAVTMAAGLVPLHAIEPAETGIPNATSPEPGVLFGGQPTAQQLHELAAADYQTVIDLRAPTEDRGYDEAAAAKAAGLDYVTIPVTEETLKDPKTLDRFIEIFNQNEKPVLVHCAAGSRVAAVYYAWLVSEKKMSREEALAKAKEEGLRRETLIPTIDAYLDQKKEAQK